MNTRRCGALAALAVLLACAGCRLEIGEGVRGNGEVVTETRALSGVDAVELACQGDLVIELGDREELVVEAESNLMDLISTDIDDGELVIRAQRGTNLRPTRGLRFTLTVRALEGITLTGSGDVEGPRLRADRLRLRLTGSGDLELRGVEAADCDLTLTGSGDATLRELTARALSVRQTGSGDVEIGSGNAETFEVHLTGSGDCDAEGLRALRADVGLSGSGGVSVHVEERLDGRITGSGGVRYGGDPEVNVKTTGSGRAKRR